MSDSHATATASGHHHAGSSPIATGEATRTRGVKRNTRRRLALYPSRIAGGMVSEFMGSGLGLASSLPGGLWAMFVGVWLIVKGFNVAAPVA